MDFGGPITSEKDHDIYFLACHKPCIQPQKYLINILITGLANDHRAIGLVEPLIQTIKKRLGCKKLASNNDNKFQ